MARNLLAQLLQKVAVLLLAGPCLRFRPRQGSRVKIGVAVIAAWLAAPAASRLVAGAASHYRSAQRSFALLARGLARISSALGRWMSGMMAR